MEKGSLNLIKFAIFALLITAMGPVLSGGARVVIEEVVVEEYKMTDGVAKISKISPLDVVMVNDKVMAMGVKEECRKSGEPCFAANQCCSRLCRLSQPAECV